MKKNRIGDIASVLPFFKKFIAASNINCSFLDKLIRWWYKEIRKSYEAGLVRELAMA